MDQSIIDVFLTMYRYPEMLQIVVESINRARKPRLYRIHGIFEYGFEESLEPIFDQILDIEKVKTKRDFKHGINWNTPRSFMDIGRETAGDYVVQLQSDIVISIDFFEYLDWIMSNTDVGYTLAYGIPSSHQRDDSAYAIKCMSGWYGHWGSAVRSTILRDIYPKYLTNDYKDNYDEYAISLFPKIMAGGSDFFINAFLHKEGISGARPLSSRTTNIGIDGEHIRLNRDAKNRYNSMNYEDKLTILRKIVDHGQYDLETNVELCGTPRILGDYSWTELHEIDIPSYQKHTGTDL